jgi:hypothetical protein
MEVVKGVKITLHIETDKRKLEKDFDNLFDIKIFMNSFFADFAERRSAKSLFRYVGPDRRLRTG